MRSMPVCQTADGYQHVIEHVLDAWEIRVEARKLYNQSHGRAAKVKVLCTPHMNQLFDSLQRGRTELPGQESLL